MAKVLLVGIDPALVDFSDPTLPPGVTAEMIREGLIKAIDDLKAMGHAPDRCYIPIDPADLGDFADRLARDPVDCVVIGGGVIIPPHNRRLFEALLNVVARAEPSPAIALVSHPGEAGEAVARVLG